MEIQLPLSADVQAKLQHRAATTGQSIDDLIVEAVEEKLAGDDLGEKDRLSSSEWKQRLREWVASHPPQDHFVDVSRDSIYRGRGE